MTKTSTFHDVLDVKYSEMLLKLRDCNLTDSDSHTNIAFLRNITIEPMIPFFQYQCMAKRINTDIYLCDFDNIMQDVLDENSGLYKHNPKIIFIFIKLELIASRLCLQFPGLDHEVWGRS